MAQYLPLPDGTYYPVAEGEDPKVAWQRAMQKYPEAFGAGEPKAQPKSGFMPALKAGVSSLKSDVAALAGRTGLMALPEAEKYIAEQEKYQKETYAPTEKGWTEDPLTKIGELAGGSIPYMVAPIAAGLAGEFIAPAAAVGATAAEVAAAARGAKILSTLGTGATSAAQFTGSNLSRQLDTGKKLGETDIGAAAVAAIPQAALDTISLNMIPGMSKLFERAGLNLSEEAAKNLAKEGLKKTVADYAVSTGKTMGVEGLTEAGQQVFERMQAGLNITDPDARKEYFDNFLGGAVLGGILAPVGRRVERGAEQARFDKQQREEQKKQADEAKAAQDKLDAETLAKKQTPEYALQAQQAYLDAEQKKKDLKAQIHKAPKGQALTEDQRLDNQETQQALAENADVLNKAAKEFRQFRQFLPKEPAPAPEAIKNTEQLQQVGMFGNLPTPKTPELDLQGKPVERTGTAEEALANEKQRSLYGPESQQAQLQQTFDMYDQTVGNRGKFNAAETKLAENDPRQQVRMLEQLVAQYQTQVQDASPQEILNIAPKYKQAQTALEQARKDVEALPKPVEDQIAKLHQKLGVAKDKGDVEKAAALSQQIVNLQSQAAPTGQQQIEMQPFKSTVTGDRQLAVRPQYAANLNLGAEEQEADVAAQQAQAEAQYRAKGTEQERQIKIAPEVRALQRIGERPAGAVSTAPQFKMFGTEPETGASAAINQVKKGLTGGEELPTAEEEKAKKPVQRGGPAPFNLYARKEGTGEPVTAESLRQRIYDLQGRDDLSDEARAFLRRAAINISEKDTAIGTNASLFTMLDEQLGKIERGEEGVHGEGAPTKPLEVKPRGGEGPLAQAMVEAGAAQPSTVTALPGSVTTPTKAERPVGTFAGKEYKLSSSDAAKALAKAKRDKYEAGIAAGLSKAEAARRASLVTQEEAIEGVMTGAAPTAVNVQGRAEPTLRTLRGPSTYAKPLSMPDALEQHLRVKEELAQDQSKQLSLFKEEELPSKALVRATPAMFQRLLASKTVQDLRDSEKEIKDQSKPLEEVNRVQASIAELQQQLKELTARYEVEKIAKNMVATNAEADAALAQYGKLQNDPYFGAVLQLDAATKSEEHARLEADIAALMKMVNDLPKQIETTQKAIDKDAAKAETPSQALRNNRVKIEILQRQQSVLTKALGDLEMLQAKAASVVAAKEHIDAMLHVIAARRALENLKGREVTREQVVRAQTDLHTAVLARRAAEENSKAKDQLRDVRDLSYATARKRQELSEQRTKAWNVLSQLPATRYRALTPEERGIVEKVEPGEVKAALAYERHLAGMDVQSLKMELGRLDAASYALEAKIKEAKAKSESFLAEGEKLAMYGEKGSIFTKPAFIGVEGFIKQQAELADKRDALEIELARKEAAMTPISTGARGEAVPREITTTRAAEQAEIDTVLEATQAAGVSREKIATLEALYKEEAQAGNAKKAQAIAQDIIKERAELAEAEKNMGKAQRRYAAKRKVAGEPSKLRTGTAESKAIPGVTKQTITEQRVEPKISTEEIIKSANEMAAEKIAAGKPLTKKEIKELTLKQQQALQAAAFDRVQTTSSQVADAQIRVDALKQAQADYAAKRRATFNLDTLTKAEKNLADAQKANKIARQQAGILEDVGTVSTAEQKAEEVPAVKESDISGAVGPAVFRTITRKGASLKEKTIERVANAITKGWSVVPDIIVVADESGLPENIQRQAERDNMVGKIPGVYDTETKKVYLVASNLFDENDIALTVAHEIAGHFGLREVLGGTYTKIMNYIYNGNAGVRAQADAKMAANDKLSREVAVEEVLAEVAEQGPKAEKGLMAALRRVWYAIKQALAKVGVFNVSDAEVNQIVVNARRYVQEGVGKKKGEAPVNEANYRTKADYASDDDLSNFAKDVVAPKKGFFEKLGGNKMLQFEMLTTDMRAGLREAMKAGAKQMGDTRLFEQAMYSVTKADQKMPLVLSALSDGPLETYTDANGLKGVRTTNENSAKEIFASTSDVPDRYGNGAAKMGIATAYMIAQRAANKGLTKLDLGALGVTEEKLAAVMRQVDADPELKKALERTRSLYNKFNEGMIRFLASTGAITKKEADGFLKEGDYVPYYRVNANGIAQLVLGAEKTITIGDIRHQPYLAQLKGGETKILPLDESLPRNTMLLVNKAMTNMATRNVAYALHAAGKGYGEVNERTGKTGDLMPIHKGDGPADPGVIRWSQEPDRNDPKDNGKRWLRVQTTDTVLGGIPAEIIVKSLEGAHLTLPGFLKLGAIAGDFLRAGVTRTPIYLLRQLFRDPFAAAATAGLDYGPLKAIYKAGNEYLKMNTGQSETAAKLIEKGLMQSGIFTGDPDDISKFALQLASGKDMGVLDKFFAMADQQAMRADAATRALVYDNAIKNGLSEVQADMAVMESMNFHKRGLSPTVQYASRMIPFFNSQIQGLNVLYKAATGGMPFNEQLRIKQKFQNNAMMLMGMGLVYAMMMDDDDYFKNAKPKDRYSNFFVHIPGADEPLKLPIPYEFGWFFSAAVAAADAMKAETDGPQQLRALREMFIGALPGSSNAFVAPQIIKPLAEVWTNKNFYSGQPLESKRLEKLAPEARYYDTTTEIAKQISKLAPILSPIQIEHIVTGYFGSLPLMAAAATDSLFKGQEAVEAPTRRLSQMPLIGSSFQRKYGGEDADVVYKLATDALQVKATFNDYKNTGRLNEAKDYFQEHRAELAVAPMALQYEKFMSTLRKQEEIIRQSNMPADKKQERIDMLDKQRQLQSERYMQAIKRAEAAVGRTTPQ